MRFFLIFVTLIILNPVLHAEEKKAYFAGGCFWCMEESFDQVEGVISTISGYSGGHLKNPKYADVRKDWKLIMYVKNVKKRKKALNKI